jgi:signal transduction histidine kinase
LVDTLLEAASQPSSRLDPATAREYLELIAKENVRLTRVIDNFLAFSRMERNKQAFTLAEIAPGDIVRAACDAVQSRFQPPGCHFEVCIAPDLPCPR